MFNNEVLKKKNKKEVLEFLNLQEHHDKFTGLTTIAPAVLGVKGLAKTIKISEGFGPRNTSEILYMRTKVDGKWTNMIEWKFLLGDDDDGLSNETNWISGFKFLFYAGDVESINFEKRELKGTRVFTLSDELFFKLIRAETLEIRVETHKKTTDYNQKKCKSLQTYLKEHYEKFLDVEEFDALQANGTLESKRDEVFSKPKSESKGKSKLGTIVKWWLILSVLVAILVTIFDKKDTSDKSLSKASPAVVLPQSENNAADNSQNNNQAGKPSEGDSGKKD